MQGDGVLLLKLHGSIDWQSKEGRSAERPMPHRVITACWLKNTKGFVLASVIFGHRNS